jgi:glycosyltransferase involved in cell wall biosynthesis
MSQAPLVSVVIPAFKQAALVTATLDSVAAQTLDGAVEVIVVDDGCPEGTGEVAAKHPLRPIVIHQKNQGVAAARNTGIVASQGRFVAFLDADDRWLPQKLETQVKSLLALGGPALGFSQYQRIDTQGKRLEDETHPGEFGDANARTLFRGNYIGCLTAIADRRCFEDVGGFPVSAALQRGGQDYALWLRIALRYPLAYQAEVLAHYVVHERSRVGVDAVKNFEGALNAIGAVWERDRELCERKLDRRYASYVLRQLGLVARNRGTWARASRAAWTALVRGPAGQRAEWPAVSPRPRSEPGAGSDG